MTSLNAAPPFYADASPYCIVVVAISHGSLWLLPRLNSLSLAPTRSLNNVTTAVMTTSGATLTTRTKSPSLEDYTDAPDDDALISGILNGDAIAGDVPGDFNFGDTVGKVDDAVDYEDISDDDLLPDEEPASTAPGAGDEDADGEDELFDLMNEGEGGAAGGALGDELDDLFGDMDPMSDPPVNGGDLDMDLPMGMSLDFGDGTVPLVSVDGVPVADGGQLMLPSGSQGSFFRDIDFGMSPGVDIMGDHSGGQRNEPSPQDLVKQYFPDFEPHKILSFNSLFKSKPATLSTTLTKQPKVCVPTKVNLEMAPDDQTLFSKATTVAGKVHLEREERGIVIIPPVIEEVDSDGEEEKEDGEDARRDASFERDLVLACDDWDSKIDAILATPPPSPVQPKREYDEDDGEFELVEARVEENRPEKVCYNIIYLDFHLHILNCVPGAADQAQLLSRCSPRFMA